MKKPRFGNHNSDCFQEEMEGIMTIAKSLEGSGLLIKGVTEAIVNEAEERKGAFFIMVLDTLGASLLGNFEIQKYY